MRLGGASGIALVFIMVTATALGAALRPGYSHIRDSISELIEVGAPNKALLGVAGFLGIILTAFFPCDVGCEANPTTISGARVTV